jgi:hypothetical protein
MGAVMSQDFAQIARNFRLVRTFYANYFGQDVMPFVAGAGLKAALGVSIGELWIHVSLIPFGAGWEGHSWLHAPGES